MRPRYSHFRGSGRITQFVRWIPKHAQCCKLKKLIVLTPIRLGEKDDEHYVHEESNGKKVG